MDLFGKNKDALNKVGVNKNPKPTTPEPLRETIFKFKEVRILRECLSGLHSKAPPMLQKKIQTALLDFANGIKDYCQCEEKSFIESELRFACLSCGNRTRQLEGDPPIASVK